MLMKIILGKTDFSYSRSGAFNSEFFNFYSRFFSIPYKFCTIYYIFTQYSSNPLCCNLCLYYSILFFSIITEAHCSLFIKPNPYSPFWHQHVSCLELHSVNINLSIFHLNIPYNLSCTI